MILVKTKVRPSAIHGTGLFADEFVPKGKRMWEFSSETDKAYTREEVEALPEPERSGILSLFHSYLSKDIGRYVVCGDGSKFINHSDNPNMISEPGLPGKETPDIAARDIQKGEEITYDYREFDEEISFEVNVLRSA